MFVFLSKLLPPFIYPLGLGCFLILLGLFLRRRVRLVPSANPSLLTRIALAVCWVMVEPPLTPRRSR